MHTAILTGIDEYLSTSYRPDCDYVDGVLLERNVGRKDHSKIHGHFEALDSVMRTHGGRISMPIADLFQTLD